MKASTLAAAVASTVLALTLLASTAPPASSATTSAAAPARPCGATIRKANGQPWVCTFDDEFSGTELNPRKWVVQTNFGPGDIWGNQSCTMNSPQNVSVSSGAVHLSVRRLAQPVFCGGLLPARFSAGSIMTWHLWSQAYGRFTARMMSPVAPGPGLHEAFWLWHDDRFTQQTTGEMDVAETYSQYPDIAIPTLHTTANVAIDGSTTAQDCEAVRGYWNTYTMEWSPHRVTIWINGRRCLVNTSADPAFAQRDILLLTAVIGQDENAPGSSTPFPATTLVDYVRVWK